MFPPTASRKVYLSFKYASLKQIEIPKVTIPTQTHHWHHSTLTV